MLLYDSELIQNGLTNRPLPFFGCRHIENICLVACVGFIVGFNVNGKLLNKGTGVSEGEEVKKIKKKTKKRHQKLSQQSKCALEVDICLHSGKHF